jgi:hypothetical protein
VLGVKDLQVLVGCGMSSAKPDRQFPLQSSHSEDLTERQQWVASGTSGPCDQWPDNDAEPPFPSIANKAHAGHKLPVVTTY